MPQEYEPEAHSSDMPRILVRMTEPNISTSRLLTTANSKPNSLLFRSASVTRSLIAALAIPLCLHAPAQAQNGRSLPETLEKSVLSHPEVQARYHDFLSVLEGKNIQRGGLLPNVSVEAHLDTHAQIQERQES